MRADWGGASEVRVLVGRWFGKPRYDEVLTREQVTELCRSGGRPRNLRDATLDATRPAGEWNHVRILVTPERCAHEINGVEYFEYVLGSEDFARRVAAGAIALQGDHGRIAFRNIKIRRIEAGR